MKRSLAILPLLASLVFGVAQAEQNTESAENTAPSRAAASAKKFAPPPAILGELALLFRLQDATAAGAKDALISQKTLLVHVGAELESFLASAPEDQIRLIAPHAIAYVLSGGDPIIGIKLSKSAALDARQRRLAEAAGIFMQGDREAAAKLLKDIDTRGLPARTLGRIALVQALLDKDDAAAEQTHFAAAMASMPGSLIEESALRRSALAYAQAKDESHFWARIERYQRRFPHSLYAHPFWTEMSDAIINWAATGSGPQLTRLERAWNSVELSHRRTLYLDLTRNAAAVNEQRITNFAAARLRRLAAEGSFEDQAARLYTSIYRIASADGDDAVRILKSINREMLGPQEQALLDAAVAMNWQISRPIPADAKSGDQTSPDDPLQVKGNSLLEDIDKLLAGLGP